MKAILTAIMLIVGCNVFSQSNTAIETERFSMRAEPMDTIVQEIYHIKISDSITKDSIVMVIPKYARQPFVGGETYYPQNQYQYRESGRLGTGLLLGVILGAAFSNSEAKSNTNTKPKHLTNSLKRYP